MRGVSMNLHWCCSVAWPCWPAPQRSPSRCPPASPESNAQAPATGGSDGGRPSCDPSRWRKPVVFWNRRTKIQNWNSGREILFLFICMCDSKFKLWAAICFQTLQCPHLSRSPEYLSTATSLGRGGREEGLGCPADAAGAGLLWEDGGDFRGRVTLLVLSTGWKELPSFISTSGPLSSAENTVKKTNSKHDFQ